MTEIVTPPSPFPTGRRDGVIYGDPPWSFRTWSGKGTGRSAVSHYDCMARETRPGWDSWGNQSALFDGGSVPTRRQPSSLVELPKTGV